ncbi:MAG: hypothetical protein IK141_06745 [Clostridia bacterium]|nr:hypothetical protein [Clostridia bacterium]
MTQDPFYRIAALLRTGESRQTIAEAALESAAEARFLLNGASLQARALPMGMTLTPEDEGKRFLCLSGEEGIVPLCALTEERMT